MNFRSVSSDELSPGVMRHGQTSLKNTDILIKIMENCTGLEDLTNNTLQNVKVRRSKHGDLQDQLACLVVSRSTMHLL